MIAPTPRDTVFRDGTAQLYRFRRTQESAEAGVPVLLIPSLINRWYVMDLRRGASLVEALTQAGLDTWCLDWGVPEDEDRYLTWEDVLARLARMFRQVQRQTGSDRVAIVGYCMGATLSGIHTALQPDNVAALVNLAGPFDFSEAGFLGHLANRRWFDASAIREAGNLRGFQMQSAFSMLRPTQQIAKWVGLFERGYDPNFRDAFQALETWANDNVDFPAAAYETYIRDLYQENSLVRGEHRVGGRRVDLSSIRCPVMTVTAERDTICPPRAATALNAHCRSSETEVCLVPGGHVGAVVGTKASEVLYPALTRFLRRTTCN
ncbi:MAG: alpha/beta fold hydrolase [Myxococcaceae bacterium]